MSTPTATPTNPTEIPQESARFDGMELNEAEAALHAQPLTEFDPASPAPATPAADEAVATTEATPAADPPPAAGAPPPPAVEPAAPVAPPPAPLFAEAPVASRDFDKEKAELRAKFEGGDLTTEEFVERSSELTIAQAEYRAAMTVYEADQKRLAAASESAKAEADKAWNAEAVAWERENAEFLSNPLRQQAMAQAIAAVDQKTGGKLSPRELLNEAAKVAFDAYGWKGNSNGSAIRDAVASRSPDPRALPTNLGSAPAAGGEDIRGNETFAALDRLDADALEDALARLPAAQREAYLADAPGARTTGRD